MDVEGDVRGGGVDDAGDIRVGAFLAMVRIFCATSPCPNPNNDMDGLGLVEVGVVGAGTDNDEVVGVVGVLGNESIDSVDTSLVNEGLSIGIGATLGVCAVVVVGVLEGVGWDGLDNIPLPISDLRSLVLVLVEVVGVEVVGGVEGEVCLDVEVEGGGCGCLEDIGVDDDGGGESSFHVK